MKIVFDIEANGLIDTVDTVWCIVLKDIDTKKVYEFDNTTSPRRLDFGLKFIDESELIIGHNIIDYDLPVLEKVCSFKAKTKVFDTLILSQLLNPERQGGHSLDSWGERLGHKKPVHEDWSQFSPEMLHRCKEDVDINEKVYYTLLGEAGKELKGLSLYD